jgi:hypothetical protein
MGKSQPNGQLCAKPAGCLFLRLKIVEEGKVGGFSQTHGKLL